MRDEPRLPARHQLDHVVPTVIHDPEEKMPALARWLRHTMANPTKFWGLVAALVIAVTGLAIASNGLSLGRTTSNEAWLRIEAATAPAERAEIAQQYPNTQAEQWGLLQAATLFYNRGFVDLPSNVDVAVPSLKQALKYFDKVALEAPQDSPQARAAALGAARTLEALNLLEKAITQYEKVASTWKESAEAADARRLAEALHRPENIQFYKDLYAYKPVEATLPPMGQGGMTLPPGGHSALDSILREPFTLPPPPAAKAATPGSKTELDPLLLPPPPAAPKDEQPKAETPKGDLPSDPFTPKE